MPLKKTEYGELIYISYSGEGYRDYEELKRALEKSACLISSTNDVAVDFTGCPDIGSPEMAALIRLVQTLQHMQRSVHVVAPPGIRNQLTSVNLHKLPFVVLHDDRASVLKSVGKKG